MQMLKTAHSIQKDIWETLALLCPLVVPAMRRAYLLCMYLIYI